LPCCLETAAYEQDSFWLGFGLCEAGRSEGTEHIFTPLALGGMRMIVVLFV